MLSSLALRRKYKTENLPIFKVEMSINPHRFLYRGIPTIYSHKSISLQRCPIIQNSMHAHGLILNLKKGKKCLCHHVFVHKYYIKTLFLHHPIRRKKLTFYRTSKYKDLYIIFTQSYLYIRKKGTSTQPAACISV